MANVAVALIALPLLVSLDQWVFIRTMAHVDPHLMPTAARRRVRWLVMHSVGIYRASAGLFVVGLALQAAALLR